MLYRIDELTLTMNDEELVSRANYYISGFVMFDRNGETIRK